MFAEIATARLATFLLLMGDTSRRWKSLFPETIYYYADIREVREKIKQMFDNKEWDSDKFPEMKQNLLKILNIKNPQDN
ncbi:unnamed protein product [Rhizophagus irregularis]|nr:unnamed protein product [Rhizophagus irregularis]